MDEAFLLDKTQVLAGGINALEVEVLADLLKGGNNTFAALMFLKKGVDLRLALSEPVRHEGNILYIITVFEKKLFTGQVRLQNFLGRVGLVRQ